MAVTWAYPWSFLGDRATASVSDLPARGFDAVNVASHYHSIRTLDPRRSGGLFESYPGGCHFDPNPDHFADTPISPPVNEVAGTGDPLGELVGRANDAGVAVNGWFVCNHNSRLGAQNPEYRVESAFGTPHDHALCPSYAAVRKYLAGVARSLAAYDLGEIQLESLGFPNAFHCHGEEFGHSKNYAVTETEEELLVSQCFCEGCYTAASDHRVDLDRAKAVVREETAGLLGDPAETVDLAALREEYPVLDDLFDFRAEVIERLARRLAAASGDTPLNYYVADGLGRGPGDGWPVGIDLERLEPHLDRVTALCYVGDAETARSRVEGVRETVSLPVDAGVSLDPDLVEDEDQFRAVVGAVRDRAEKLHVYNYSLLGDEQLDWLAATLA
jgi:hypothetical protein